MLLDFVRAFNCERCSIVMLCNSALCSYSSFINLISDDECDWEKDLFVQEMSAAGSAIAFEDRYAIGKLF